MRLQRYNNLLAAGSIFAPARLRKAVECLHMVQESGNEAKQEFFVGHVSLSVLKAPVLKWQTEKGQFVALQASTLEISRGVGNVGLKIL